MRFSTGILEGLTCRKEENLSVENIHREFGKDLSLLRKRFRAGEDVNNLFRNPRKEKEPNFKPNNESRKGDANMLDKDKKKKPVDDSDEKAMASSEQNEEDDEKDSDEERYNIADSGANEEGEEKSSDEPTDKDGKGDESSSDEENETANGSDNDEGSEETDMKLVSCQSY